MTTLQWRAANSLTMALRGFGKELRADIGKDVARGHARLEEQLAKIEDNLRGDLSALQTSVGAYLKRTEEWQQEHAILRARYRLLVQVLTENGLVSEEELILT